MSKRWPEILNDCGINGRRVVARDWSLTSLGPINHWPVVLQTSLMTCLSSRFPMSVMWGEEHFHFYNDAAKTIIGGRDDDNAFGAPIRVHYEEVWELISPMFTSVLNSGLATWVEDQYVLISRNGFPEEAYMTWSYSPIRDASGEICGINCVIIETTSKVIGERRLLMLQELSKKANGKLSIQSACYECIEILKLNDSDIPFAAIRILDKQKTSAKVMGIFGIKVPDRGLRESSENFHPALIECMNSKRPVFVNKLPEDVEADGKNVEKIQSVYVLPLIDVNNKKSVIGFLSVGLNPKRPFDKEYEKFLDLLADHIAISIISASAHEDALENAAAQGRGEIHKLSQLLDASPDHVFIFDKEGRYRYHNKATAGALQANLEAQGRGHEPTLNRNGAEMNFEESFLKRFMKAKDEAFEGRISMIPVAFPSPIGVRDFECILSPMHDDNGQVVAVAGVTRDVTDLKQSIKVRDEFLSIASHELKTPLTTLMLTAQMRSRRLKKGIKDYFSEEKLEKMFKDDDNQFKRLNRLIDDMLDTSRINAGRIDLEIEEVDISQMITEILDRMSLHLDTIGIDVILNVSSIKGMWDRYRIEQVITNLITNAIKYGNKKPITIGTHIEGENMILSVADQGIGIKKEDHKRIFQQFERAISSSTVSGLGLGLFIVDKILKIHGGSIHVESADKKGSKFIVTLPLKTKLINS